MVIYAVASVNTAAVTVGYRHAIYGFIRKFWKKYFPNTVCSDKENDRIKYTVLIYTGMQSHS